MCKCNISQRLTELRTAKGVTQEELASALSVSNKTISKWENGVSAPDLSMLIALSEYYGVTADSLLGLREEEKNRDGIIRELFEGLDSQEGALQLFRIIESTFSPMFGAADTAEHGSVALLPGSGKAYRNRIALKELFSYEICSEDVNLAVVQLRNRSDFAWLFDPEKQKRMTDLFEFLADPDALKILAYIHSAACPDNFTVHYMAQKAEVSPEKTADVLEQSCRFGLCSKMTAHLRTGEAVVYESQGDGLLLCLLSLAFEKTWVKNRSFLTNYGRTCKMIMGTDRRESE